MIEVYYSDWRRFDQQQGKKEGQFLLGMAPHLLTAGKVRKEGYEERSLRSLFF